MSIRTASEGKGFGPLAITLGALALVGSVVGIVYANLEGGTEPSVCAALARARIVQVLAPRGVELRCEQVEVTRLDTERVRELLDANDAQKLASVLRETKAAAIAVVPNAQQKGVGKALASYAAVPGLTGVVLGKTLAVYAPSRAPALGDKERDALVYVARALLRGAREPSLSSFPPSLRRVQSVEVMVAIGSPGQGPLLWRSARATSIPRALLTATRVARDRWHEREATLGGPLRERLASLDVTVSLLVEDGVLAETTQPFVDRAITKAHGLGFDYRSDWHYLVPADVQKRGQGSAYRALGELAKEYALGLSIFAQEGARLYRFVVQPVGTSPATVREP